MSNISVKSEEKNTTEKMTVLPGVSLSGFRGFVHQVLIVILINIPTLSFGLAFGWVSLVSGEDGEGQGEAVVAGVTTFSACMVGVPLSAWAISIGRKFAIIATSFLFVLCWSLKLASGSIGIWAVVCARVVAGLGGASAWALAPLLAREMCSDKYRGAAVTTLPLMNNLGILLMYLAADAGLAHSTILWLCLGVSVVHCFVSLPMPESPAFLAAKGKTDEAQKSLAWLRGMSPDDPALSTELATLPTPEPYERSPFGLAKAMLRDPRRRKAFIIGTIAIVGQEMCGILAIMQYAERVFILAGDGKSEAMAVVPEDMLEVVPTESLISPSRHAVLLGAVQFVFSAFALYLVERVGRRPLLVSCAALTGAALAASAAMVNAGSAHFAAIGLAAAVAADAAGLQPAPYSLLADMFDYEFRGCALMLASAGANAGNTLESAIFPAVVSVGGLTAALGLGAAVTLVYAVFAAWTVPETKGRNPEEIYKILCPNYKPDCETGPETMEHKSKSIPTINNEVIRDKKISKLNNNNCKKIDLDAPSVNAKQKKCHQDIRDPSYRIDKINYEAADHDTVHSKIISNICSESYLNDCNALKNCQNKIEKYAEEIVKDQSGNDNGGKIINEMYTRNDYFMQRDFDDCFD